jgi:hypothetical protein
VVVCAVIAAVVSKVSALATKHIFSHNGSMTKGVAPLLCGCAICRLPRMISPAT